MRFGFKQPNNFQPFETNRKKISQRDKLVRILTVCGEAPPSVINNKTSMFHRHN